MLALMQVAHPGSCESHALGQELSHGRRQAPARGLQPQGTRCLRAVATAPQTLTGLEAAGPCSRRERAASILRMECTGSPPAAAFWIKAGDEVSFRIRRLALLRRCRADEPFAQSDSRAALACPPADPESRPLPSPAWLQRFDTRGDSANVQCFPFLPV